jgi:hypothetical protein
MNLRETAKVLAKAAAFDQRTVGEADVLAWHETIADLDAEDALAAVTRWYRDRADRLMPSHLREAVALVRADRRRSARLKAEQEAAENRPEQAPGRRFADLGTETREELRALSKGLLGERWPGVAEMTGERFAPPKITTIKTPLVTKDGEGTARVWEPGRVYGDD